MYSPDEIETISREHIMLTREYYELTKSITVQGQALTNDRAREHMLHGIGRRVFVLKRAVENIFRIFPLDTTTLLSQDDLHDVQINLHAFTMNLYGVFENCAWAFVIFHDLENIIGSRLKISLFKNDTKRHLPEALQNYLNLQSNKDWHKYLKSYRDSLAHRIPLYIPPANFTSEDSERYNELQEEQMQCFRDYAGGDGDFSLLDRAEQIGAELTGIGSPFPVFLHSLPDDTTGPIMIHPQLISDSRAVIEFVNLFLKEWRGR